MKNIRLLQKDLRSYVNKEKAAFFPRFFKTGKGQYGEGDIFIGVTVPNIRKIALQYSNLSLEEIEALLQSPIHEERLAALFILVKQYKKGDEKQKKKIYTFYLSHTKHINNWDLVDSSAQYIVGDYLVDKDRKILLRLAKSKNLWEKRISIIATFAFIYHKEHAWTFTIAELLMKDDHDLIHKAVGWMLREVGKRVSEKTLCSFLDIHASHMPRTMLRYAIEKLSPAQRMKYMRA